MIKPVTGQYECQHSSGIGLDYFTSRIDRLTIQPNGRFILIVQERSRVANAAQSLVSGQQVTNAAPEVRREGNYTLQDNVIQLHFDDGKQDQGQVSWNGEGIQFGPDFFNKVSDSTFLPPTHRMKKDMDDIAKGLKIASTIGGIAFKAAKTIHETIQSTQTPGTASTPSQSSGSAPSSPPQQPAPPPAQPARPAQGQHAAPPPPAAPSVPPTAPSPPNVPPQPTQGQMEAIFCDQCGTRSRPGKRFCNNCGARLL